MEITKCPTCGSKNIKRVQKDYSRRYKGKQYVVPNLEFFECPRCGEKVFDPHALRKIEDHSPAFAKTTAGR